MTLAEIRRSKRQEILEIAARHGASNVRVFGSVARCQATALSDLDLLVDLAPDRTLMDLGGLLMEIQAELGIPVDVATERMLRREVKQNVLAEAVPL